MTVSLTISEESTVDDVVNKLKELISVLEDEYSDARISISLYLEIFYDEDDSTDEDGEIDTIEIDELNPTVEDDEDYDENNKEKKTIIDVLKEKLDKIEKKRLFLNSSFYNILQNTQ